MVNLELYKIFVIVAEEQNITRASEKLNISQPAVTKHIKNLEQQLNTKLFERNKGMILTQKGEELYKKIELSIKSLLEVGAEFLQVRYINFGTYSTMNSKILSECINKYYQKNKETNINITTNKVKELISLLEKSKLDIILSKQIDKNLYNENQIKYIKLGNLEEVLITNKNSKLKEKSIEVKDLKEEIIYIPRNNSKTINNFVAELKKVGIVNIKRIDSSTMIKILEKGEGVGLITKEYIDEELKENKLIILKTKFDIQASEFGIYIRKNENFKQLKDFIEILKERFK